MKNQNSEILKCVKMADFALLTEPKSISRKIRVIEKLWNYHTVSNCTLFFQVSLDDSGKQTDPIYLYAQKQHLFAEGPDFLLSDALLYPQFSLVMKFMASLTSEAAAEAKFRQLMPKTCAWLDRVTGKELTEKEAFTENCQILASALSATASFSVSSSLTSGYEKDDKCTEKSADTVVPIFHDLKRPPNVSEGFPIL